MAADGRVVIDTKIDPSGAEKGMNELGGRLEKAAGRAKSVGTKMTAYLTAPIAAVGAFAVTAAMTQEKAFAQVSTLLDMSSADLAKYKDEIRAASTEMGIGFEEYSAAVYESMSSGIDQADAIQFATKMAKLAKGGFTDMATATDVVTTAINAYGLGIEDTDAIMDTLINTQDLGKTTVDELAGSMGSVIPIAQAQGVSFDQLASGYAILTSNGIATAEAGTYMKAMFGELGKAGSDVDKILRTETGKSFSELQAAGMSTGDVLAILQTHAENAGLKMSDLFGSSEAGASALVLSKDSGEAFNETLVKMQGAAGATDESFKKMNDTTGAKTQKAWVTMQNAAAEMGDVLLPIISKLLTFVAGLVEKFANLSPAAQMVIMVIAGIVAVVGPLLVVISMLIPLFLLVTGTMVAWGAAILGIVAIVVVVAYMIYKYWDEIKAFTIAVFTAIWDFMKICWEGIKTAFSVSLEFVKSVISVAWNWITTTTMSVWTAITGFLSGVWSAIIGFATPIFNGIKNFIAGVWNAISSVVMSVWGFISQYLQAIWQSMLFIVTPIFNAIKTYITGVWDGIKSVTSSVWNGIKAAIMIVWLLIKSGATTVFNAIKSFITGVWNGIKSVSSSVWNAIKGVVMGPINSLKSTAVSAFTALASAVGRIWGGIKSTASSVFNGIKTVIMGIVNAITGAVGRAWGGMKGTAVSAFNGLKGAIRSVLNGIISIINRMIGGFNTPAIAMNKLPGVSAPLIPKIPSLDVGTNFVAKDGLAMIHAGEAVVPKKYNPAAGGTSPGEDKKPAKITLVLGGNEYDVFVDDITERQERKRHRLKRR